MFSLRIKERMVDLEAGVLGDKVLELKLLLLVELFLK
jgi:hypothetical protein